MAGTGSISGNDTAARRKALADANNFCAGKGQQILVQNIGAKSTMYGSTSDIIFQCLSPGDPGLQAAPEYRKEADVLIEDAR